MPKTAREDGTSLMKDIGILQPKETGIMATNTMDPGSGEFQWSFPQFIGLI